MHAVAAEPAWRSVAAQPVLGWKVLAAQPLCRRVARAAAAAAGSVSAAGCVLPATPGEPVAMPAAVAVGSQLAWAPVLRMLRVCLTCQLQAPLQMTVQGQIIGCISFCVALSPR